MKRNFHRSELRYLQDAQIVAASSLGTGATTAHARTVHPGIDDGASTLRRRLVRSSFVALAAMAGLGLADAVGTQKEFTSGTSLTSSGNYTPTGAPASTDNVVIDGGSPTGGAYSITAATLNIEDLAFSLATTTSISNTTSTTTASTLELNGGRGSSTPLLDENSTKTLTIKNGSTGALNVQLDTSGAFEIDSSGGLTISSNITQLNGVAAALTIKGTGGGVVTLSGTNTFSGGLVAQGTEVDATSDASLGAAGGSLTINGGRLGFNGTYTVDSTRSFYLGANSSGGNKTGSLSVGSGFTATINQGIQNLSGAVGDLVKQATGTLVLGGQSSYSGNTFLNNGTTKIAVANALPSTTTLALGQTASANVGAFDLNGFNQQVAGLNSTNATTGAPTAKNTVTASAAGTLTLGGSGTYVYGDGSATNSGIITGALSINKTGTGTQTFGDTNTYTGSTTVSGGTLVLSSNGSINGSTSVVVNGTGALTLQNATSLTDTGTLSLTSGTTLSLNAGSGTSESIGVLILDGTMEAAGTYTASQLTALDSGINFSSSNGETLTVVPEPATVAGGLLMVGALGWTLRRRLVCPLPV